MSLHCQGYAHLLWLDCIILEVSNEVWSLKGESGISAGLYLVTGGQRWVWLPVWPCAAARRPRPGLSVAPSGRRSHPGSAAARRAGHTPGSCQQPEPAITHTQRRGVCVSVCDCILYSEGKVTFQLFRC